MEQSKETSSPRTSQTKRWSDAELRRVARVFDVLIRVEKRLRQERGNDNAKQPKPPQKAS